VVPTSVQVPQFTMSVDRPFVVAIADRSTGAVLFAGAVNNPKG
jgi:serine protease inhibitor